MRFKNRYFRNFCLIVMFLVFAFCGLFALNQLKIHAATNGVILTSETVVYDDLDSQHKVHNKKNSNTVVVQPGQTIRIRPYAFCCNNGMPYIASWVSRDGQRIINFNTYVGATENVYGRVPGADNSYGPWRLYRKSAQYTYRNETNNAQTYEFYLKTTYDTSYCVNGCGIGGKIDATVYTTIYDITYNANGGSGTTAAQQMEHSTSINLQYNAFTAPSGKYFKEWNTQPDGKGVSYKQGELYATNKDIVLYAIWKDPVSVYCNDYIIHADGSEELVFQREPKLYELGSVARGSDWGTENIKHYTYQSDTSITLDAEHAEPISEDKFTSISHSDSLGKDNVDIPVGTPPEGKTLMYGVDPFPAEYSNGFLLNSSSKVEVKGATLAQSTSHTQYKMAYNNNTSKKSNIYIKYYDAAIMNGDLLDIVVYCWSPSADNYWYMDMVKKGSQSSTSQPNFLYQGFYEYHFFKAGTDIEVPFKGTLSILDLDASETECIWAKSATPLYYRDNTYVYKSGTPKNRGNSIAVGKFNSKRDNSAAYLGIETSLDAPLIVLWSGANGATISTGVDVTYNLSDVPAGMESTYTRKCAKYGIFDVTQYDPVKSANLSDSYVFSGWYWDAEMTKPVSKYRSYNGCNLDFVSTNLTFYGKFCKDISLNINPNGGTYNGSTDVTVIGGNYGSIVNLNEPAREGYIFVGWAKSSDFKGTVSNDLSEYTFPSSSVLDGHVDCLVAQWVPNVVKRYFGMQYVVKFNPNSDEDTELMSNQSFTPGVGQDLNLNQYSWLHHKFIGWNTKPDGSGTVLSDGQYLTLRDGDPILNVSYSNIDYTMEEIYKQWDSYPKPTTTDLIGNWIVNDSHISKTGKESANRMSQIFLLSDTEDMYTIDMSADVVTHPCGHGSGFVVSWNKETDVGYVLMMNDNTPTAYEGNPYGCGKTVLKRIPNFSELPSKRMYPSDNLKHPNLSLSYENYNLASVNTYTYTKHYAAHGVYKGAWYEAAKNKGDITNLRFTVDESGLFTCYIAGKKAFTYDMGDEFVGNSGLYFCCCGAMTNVTVSGKSSTLNLYAQWSNEYYVQFDPNGADIESDEDLMDIMTCYFGDTYKIPECEYSRYGYVFNGWSTSPDGTGQIYKTDDEFVDLASEADEYVILYAQWLPDEDLQAKLYVDPNSGVYRGSEQVQLFTWSPVSSTTYSYYYTGGFQTFTCPEDGWYFLEAMGAQGGSDACAGGKGGYVKSYVKLTKGQKLYIGVGQAGWCSGGAANLAYNPTYGAGGRTACNWDSYPICSGVGGGATIVATELHGNGDIRHYANNKNSLLVVAGGGGGGSNTRAGAGGTVLYNSNGVANGASTSLLNGTFGLGSNHGNASGRAEDGGGGGGGYIGGVVGWDDAGYGSHGSGGGASFVNTSRGCYDAVLIPNYRAGDGFVRITCFPDDAAHALTPDPYRTGWSFVGWELNNEKSSGEVYLHHNSVEPLWWVDFKKGTAYVQSVWRRTMSLTLDADPVRNMDSGSEMYIGETTWTQTITDNTTKYFRWDDTVSASEGNFVDNMTREKGCYVVTYARNDSPDSEMQIVSTGLAPVKSTEWGSDDVVITTGDNAGYSNTYPKFRGWSTEKFMPGEYLGTYKGSVIAGSGSWINLKTQNANWQSYKQYLYNIEGNKYPVEGAMGIELDARLSKFNTKLGVEPYDKCNITIYPTWYRSSVKLPDAQRNSDKTGNGETPDLFIGWFTEPQLDADTNYGGEFVGRAGDVVVVDRDIILYPWFNKAPTIYRSEIGNGGNSGTFWEGEPISYEQLLTLVNANDKDNYVDINKRNEEIQWNGIDAWNDGIDDWNDGEQAWGGNTNAYTPGDDSHGESQNWNDDVASTIDWETFSKTNAWKTLYTLNVDVYLHDYVYNSPDFASLTDVEKDALIEDAKQRLLDYENQYDTNNQDDNNDFQVFITGISYYCDGVDTKDVPTKSNPDVANVDSSGNYLQSHIEKLYSNNYSATNGLYDGYEVEYDDMYDVNANGLQTDTPFVGKIVIHYAIVDNGTFDFYNDKYVTTANGYKIDSNIVVQFDLETEIKFDTRPKYETHSLVIYSSDPDWNADNVKEKVLAKQILTDVEDNMNNHPWWYKDVTTPALIQTKEIINIENIMFQDYFEHEHEAVCDRIKQIDDIEALFRLKESSDEEEVEAFKHIVNFDVIVDAHDQWNKYASDARCGQNKTERTFKVIMFNNFDDDDIFYGSYHEALRYINSDWTDTLGETSYWGDSEYGQPTLETTFTRYVDKGTLTANSYSGAIKNPTPDDVNRTINITVNDYSD